MQSEGLLVPIILFLVVGTVLIILITTRHRERIAMVEKGLSSDEIKAMAARPEHPRNPLASLKWGILFVMAGCAILIGIYLHEHYVVQEGVTVGLICLFLGIGLVIYYGLAAKRLK